MFHLLMHDKFQITMSMNCPKPDQVSNFLKGCAETNLNLENLISMMVTANAEDDKRRELNSARLRSHAPTNTEDNNDNVKQVTFADTVRGQNDEQTTQNTTQYQINHGGLNLPPNIDDQIADESKSTKIQEIQTPLHTKKLRHEMDQRTAFLRHNQDSLRTDQDTLKDDMQCTKEQIAISRHEQMSFTQGINKAVNTRIDEHSESITTQLNVHTDNMDKKIDRLIAMYNKLITNQNEQRDQIDHFISTQAKYVENRAAQDKTNEAIRHKWPNMEVLEEVPIPPVIINNMGPKEPLLTREELKPYLDISSISSELELSEEQIVEPIREVQRVQFCDRLSNIKPAPKSIKVVTSTKTTATRKLALNIKDADAGLCIHMTNDACDTFAETKDGLIVLFQNVCDPNLVIQSSKSVLRIHFEKDQSSNKIVTQIFCITEVAAQNFVSNVKTFVMRSKNYVQRHWKISIWKVKTEHYIQQRNNNAGRGGGSSMSKGYRGRGRGRGRGVGRGRGRGRGNASALRKKSNDDPELRRKIKEAKALLAKHSGQ